MGSNEIITPCGPLKADGVTITALIFVLIIVIVAIVVMKKSNDSVESSIPNPVDIEKSK